MRKEMEHTQLLLLSLLAEKEMYGYQITKELSERSERYFELKEGTLYPLLHGMLQDGFLTCRTMPAETGKMRKYYSITEKGLRLLQEEREGWKALSRAVQLIVTD